MTPPFGEWLRAFGLTLVLEAPVYALFLRAAGFGPTGGVLVIVAVNLVTHPALWYIYPRFSPYWAWLLLGEGLVVLVEAALLSRWFGTRRALLGALLANISSTVLGLMVLRLL